MPFFYLYALIELLAIFLDSNVIPSANVSYPVRANNEGANVASHASSSGLRRFIQAL
jgi:hypothetical protein